MFFIGMRVNPVPTIVPTRLAQFLLGRVEFDAYDGKTLAYKRHICNTYVSSLCGIRSCPSKFLVFVAMIAFLSFSLVKKFISGVCKKVLPGYRTPYQEYTVHTNLITPKTLGYCMIWSYPKIVLRLTALSTNYFFHC